jgi:hypothetical protein
VRDPFPQQPDTAQPNQPLAKRIFEITPLPNDVSNPLIANNLKIPVATNGFPNRNDDPTTVRIDHRFTEKTTVLSRSTAAESISNFLGTASNNGAPTANSEANVTFLPMSAIAGAFSWTHTFSPTFFVETLFNRTWQSTQTIAGPVDAQKDWSKELGLPNPFGEIGFPNLTSLGLTLAATAIGNANNYTYIEGDNRRALHSIITHLSRTTLG